MPVLLNIWQILGLVLASALLWMHYVQLKDRLQPEPRHRLLLAFLLGIAACGLTMLIFSALDAIGLPDIKFNERCWNAVYCFLIAGPLEEGTKVLAALLFVYRWREFDEPLDGFVYAAAIALGFASLENFHADADTSWPQQLARTAALPITHVLFSSIWGFGIGYARFCLPRSSRRTLWQMGSVALGMFVHGLYDFLLYAYQATFAMAGLALALWLFLIWSARTFAKLPAIPQLAQSQDGDCAFPKQK